MDIKTIKHDEEHLMEEIGNGFLDGASMCFKTYFFWNWPPPGGFSCHAPNLRRGFSEFYMMSLQNKMVKPFGAQMCYKTFWAPSLLVVEGPNIY